MSRLDTVQWGADRLRVGPWRGNPDIAYLAPTPGIPLSDEGVRRFVGLLADQGYGSILTSALTRPEQEAFADAGFAVYEHLHLLRRTLDRPIPEPSPPTRRARRRDRADILAVDHLAFDPFWRFDQAGLDDARSATPTSRSRVVDEGSGVVGYAVTGRAGPLGYLQRLAVHPARQRRGIGAALVLDALRWSRRHAVRAVLVNTQEQNTGALALYERLGFELEPDGLDVMQIELRPHGSTT
ncbi:MAG: GNAT family N-acetyltransferase [Acidimicrobiales bacterium]